MYWQGFESLCLFPSFLGFPVSQKRALWDGELLNTRKFRTSSQQELLSPYNLQLITSFVFIQRTVWDLFAQMHEHSNALNWMRACSFSNVEGSSLPFWHIIIPNRREVFNCWGVSLPKGLHFLFGFLHFTPYLQHTTKMVFILAET